MTPMFVNVNRKQPHFINMNHVVSFYQEGIQTVMLFTTTPTKQFYDIPISQIIHQLNYGCNVFHEE